MSGFGSCQDFWFRAADGLCAGESGSRQEMSLQQFSDLLDLAMKVPKERAKVLFSVLSHPKPFAGVMGVECDGLDDDAGEGSTLDFRRFLLAAVTALDESAISKDSSEFIFNIYDADADGVRRPSLLPVLPNAQSIFADTRFIRRPLRTASSVRSCSICTRSLALLPPNTPRCPQMKLRRGFGSRARRTKAAL